MQHVDEALLIAYADDALGRDERRVVDEHLAVCAECRARMAEEREMSARAAQVLGMAAPVEYVVPPFEDVLRRSDSSAPRARRRSSWVPLAWAASLVVAVGAGWMARALLLSPEFAAPVESRAQTDATSTPEQELAEVAPADASMRPAAAAGPAQTERRERTPAVGEPAPAVPQTNAGAVAAADAVESDAPQTPAPGMARDELLVRSEAKAASPLQAQRSAAAPARAAAALGVSADDGALPEVNARAAAWRGNAADAAAAAITPVRALPDVALDTIWVASDTAGWQTRVLQQPSAGTVEIIEWRRAAGDGILASGTLEDGRNYLLGGLDGTLLELRGRLSIADLEMLFTRIRLVR